MEFLHANSIELGSYISNVKCKIAKKEERLGILFTTLEEKKKLKL